MTLVTLIDATHADVASIPAGTPKVGGYTTGTPDIAWTAADWARFPNAGHVRIDQDAAASDPLGSDVLDVETAAATPAEAPGWVHTRLARGIDQSTIYGSNAAGSSILAAVTTALLQSEAQYGRGWWRGHVQCGLADWNLTLPQASALIGTEIQGLRCVWVQYASPAQGSGGPYDRGVADAGFCAAPLRLVSVNRSGAVLNSGAVIGWA